MGRDTLVALFRCFPRSQRSRSSAALRASSEAPRNAALSLEVFKSAARPSSCFPTHGAMNLRHGWGTRHSRGQVSVASPLLGSQRILVGEADCESIIFSSIGSGRRLTICVSTWPGVCTRTRQSG